MINEALLEQRKNSLLQYRNLNKEKVQKFIQTLKNLDEWECVRINPFRFAEKLKIEKNESVDLFVHAARVGIVDFQYNLICPFCGGIAHSRKALDEIESEKFYCSVCNIYSDTTLDDQVEVSFAPSASIYKQNLDVFGKFENYSKNNFTANVIRSKEHREFVAEIIKDYFFLEPNTKIDYKLSLPTNSRMQFACIENNYSFMVNSKDSTGLSNQLQLDFLDHNFGMQEVEARSGEISATFQNLTSHKLGVIVFEPHPEEILEIIKKFPPTRFPYLTAKMLLNNQSFRDLFRTQNLSDSMNLNVKSLTILFTDLRGSTEMYDRAGDITAYKLVQDHFDALIAVVKKFSGAIIKTMGDAIMAAFSTPLDGLNASLEMMKKIDELNHEWKKKGYEIGLKVGINEGSALAVVNDERLDYFGQSVNIAARVQALASAGEIWITDSIFSVSGISDILTEADLKWEKHSAILKGVGSPAIVYKLLR